MWQKTLVEIKKGKIFENRTKKYLVPLLKEYGSKFVSRINTNQVLAFGICDHEITDIIEDKIYIYFDKNGFSSYDDYINKEKGQLTFKRFLEFVEQEEYFDKYYHLNDDHCVVVINLPHAVMDLFLNGAYSKIYDNDDKKKFLKQNVKNIVNKEDSYFQLFEKIIQEDFNTTIEIDKTVLKEFDYPPILTQEIFHYDRNS